MKDPRSEYPKAIPVPKKHITELKKLGFEFRQAVGKCVWVYIKDRFAEIDLSTRIGSY